MLRFCNWTPSLWSVEKKTMQSRLAAYAIHPKHVTYIRFDCCIVTALGNGVICLCVPETFAYKSRSESFLLTERIHVFIPVPQTWSILQLLIGWRSIGCCYFQANKMPRGVWKTSNDSLWKTTKSWALSWPGTNKREEEIKKEKRIKKWVGVSFFFFFFFSLRSKYK